MRKIRIVIADDHAVVRQGTRSLLEREKDLEVVGEAGDGEEAVRLIDQLKPDVAIIDIAMPRLNGVEVTRQVKPLCPSTAVLILTAYDDDEYIFALQEVRHFSQQLRPSILDDLGLLPAVKWLASELTKNYGVATDMEVVGKHRQLSPEAELVLFRIAQEALTNVRRHSEANRVCVGVEFADHNTKMTVTDNGKGFEMPARVGDLVRIGKLGLSRGARASSAVGRHLNYRH